MMITDRWRRSFAALPDATRGILWMLLATILLSGMAMMVKLASDTLHPIEILFFRSAFGMFFMLPFVMRTGVAALKTDRFPLYVLRAAIGVGAGSCAFYAFSAIPLAEATSIIFSRPLFATIIAIVVLGEVVGPRRWGAMLVGFIGVLVIVRPDIGEINLGVTLALVAAVGAAAAAIVGRVLARHEPADKMTVYFMVLQAPLALIPALLVWTTPSLHDVGILVLMAAFGTFGQRAIARAFGAGEISLILPFDFLRLPFAAIIGFVVFADVPGIWVFVGGGIIFTSSVYIARREARKARKAAPPEILS